MRLLKALQAIAPSWLQTTKPLKELVVPEGMREQAAIAVEAATLIRALETNLRRNGRDDISFTLPDIPLFQGKGDPWELRLARPVWYGSDGLVAADKIPTCPIQLTGYSGSTSLDFSIFPDGRLDRAVARTTFFEGDFSAGRDHTFGSKSTLELLRAVKVEVIAAATTSSADRRAESRRVQRTQAAAI